MNTFCYFYPKWYKCWQLLLSILLLALVIGCSGEGNALNHPPSAGKTPLVGIETAKIVYTNDRSLLTAINGSSGAIAWRYRSSFPLNFFIGASNPLGNALFASTSDGAQVHLVSLQAATGQVIWSVALPLQYAGVPVGADGLIYLGGAVISAFKPETGQQVWIARPDAGHFRGRPLISNGVVYATGDDGLYAFDEASGKKLWKNSQITSLHRLTASHDLLYIVQDTNSVKDTILALNAKSGALAWQFQTGGKIQEELRIANGLLYFSTTDNFVSALKENAPVLVWRTPLFSPGVPGAVTGSNIYVTGMQGDQNIAYELAWDSGTILWQSDFSFWKLSKHRPKVVGLVYLARDAAHDVSDGYVVALNPVTGKAVWQTQVDGGDDGSLAEVGVWCTPAAPGCSES